MTTILTPLVGYGLYKINAGFGEKNRFNPMKSISDLALNLNYYFPNKGGFGGWAWMIAKALAVGAIVSVTGIKGGYHYLSNLNDFKNNIVNAVAPHRTGTMPSLEAIIEPTNEYGAEILAATATPTQQPTPTKTPTAVPTNTPIPTSTPAPAGAVDSSIKATPTAPWLGDWVPNANLIHNYTLDNVILAASYGRPPIEPGKSGWGSLWQYDGSLKLEGIDDLINKAEWYAGMVDYWKLLPPQKSVVDSKIDLARLQAKKVIPVLNITYDVVSSSGSQRGHLEEAYVDNLIKRAGERGTIVMLDLQAGNQDPFEMAKMVIDKHLTRGHDNLFFDVDAEWCNGCNADNIQKAADYYFQKRQELGFTTPGVFAVYAFRGSDYSWISQIQKRDYGLLGRLVVLFDGIVKDGSFTANGQKNNDLVDDKLAAYQYFLKMTGSDTSFAGAMEFRTSWDKFEFIDRSEFLQLANLLLYIRQ